jgi:hypothetical protein
MAERPRMTGRWSGSVEPPRIEKPFVHKKKGPKKGNKKKYRAYADVATESVLINCGRGGFKLG